jgi:hypothetical protein
VALAGGDLTLVFDDTDQTVGLRFGSIQIPRGASIVSAHIQFQADAASSIPTSLLIQGEAADSAATFTTTKFNLSSRTRTSASVNWNPPSWPTVGAAGPDQRTPDIASIVQQIVDRPGWNPGNSLAILITGSGTREVESYEGKAAAAALLHVEYATGSASLMAATMPAPSIAFSKKAPPPADVLIAASIVPTASPLRQYKPVGIVGPFMMPFVDTEQPAVADAEPVLDCSFNGKVKPVDEDLLAVDAIFAEFVKAV